MIQSELLLEHFWQFEKVKSVSNPTIGDFTNNWAPKNILLLLSGIVDSWDASSKWDLGFLNQILDTTEVLFPAKRKATWLILNAH